MERRVTTGPEGLPTLSAILSPGFKPGDRVRITLVRAGERGGK